MIVLSTHAKGLILAIVAVLILTPDAVLVRKLGHLPNFVVMFYRNLIFTVCIFLYEILRFGLKLLIPNFRAIGWLGWVAGLVWGTTNILITYGFQSTAVANVLVIIASNPMFAALFSFVILKETVPWYTIAAGLVCFGAIVSIFYTELSGSSNASDIAGLLSALGAAIGMGLYFVLLRVIDTRSVTSHPDSMPCIIIAGVFACVVSLIVDQDQVVTSGTDWLYLLLDGIIVLAVSFGLLNICPTMISATEVSLITLIETVLGPVLVFAAGYEKPPATAVYGGSVLAAALVVHSIVALRLEKSQQIPAAIEGGISSEDSPTISEPENLNVIANPTKTSNDYPFHSNESPV